MTSPATMTVRAGESSRRPFRVWPGVAVVSLQWLLSVAVPLLFPSASGLWVIAALGGGVAIAIWWLFLSRVPWVERLGAIVLMVAAVTATYRVVHPSIAGGMMGLMLVLLSVPLLSLALVAWTASAQRLPERLQRVWLVAAILLACSVWTVVRTDGITGEGGPQLAWRWSETAEQRLLARAGDEPAPTVAVAAESPGAPAPARRDDDIVSAPTVPEVSSVVTRAAPPTIIRGIEWPGFRGRDRDSVVHNVRIETDWTQSPPVALWRRPVGPGWSSFAVGGDLVYTQEQRGEDEIVAAYRLSDGAPVWRHSDRVRFWESNGGAGPRATPTLSGDRVYTFGATGILNALDARTGSVVWSRDVAAETHSNVPMWGFSSSPLVIDRLVVVAPSGTLAAYDAESGTLRWVGPAHGGSYSSPHRMMIDGVVQVLLLNGAGATSVDVSTGKLLWEHAWPGTTIVQPALTPDGDVVVTTATGTGGVGLRRLSVRHDTSGWTATERWTSSGLKPYFNDFVIHKGYAFGFDGSILSCVDLTDGTRRWKGGRYGHGQLILLPDQDALLVVSEDGELALVSAVPDEYRELGRVSALDGKTWNHPVLVRNVLLVRNGQEMAAFRLPPSRR
jgi:outer membrane protein assembly factor BamB